MRRRSAIVSFVLLQFALLTGDAAAQRTRPCTGDNGGLKLPPGFCAEVVAEGIGPVRHFVVAPSGDIYAAVNGGRNGGGGLLLLRDADGDGRFEVRRRLWDNGGSGVALRGSDLYYATNDAVLRFGLNGGRPDTIVRDLPTGGHTAKTIALGKDGALYVNVGSRTNSCQQQDRQDRSTGRDPCTELETRAGIWRFDAARTGQRQADGMRFATGLRNVVALHVHPLTGEVYGAQHGRDQLGQNWGFSERDNAELPSEIFVKIAQGDDFGWPYCYHDRFQKKQVLAPEYGGNGREVGRCAAKKSALVAFPGHWAPEAVAFYTGTQFPAAYRGGVFIAFHGSWNRAPLPQAGFQVVFQPFSKGVPRGEYRTFADGFQAVGTRPMGLAVGPDGSLYIGADTGERIWRVRWQGGR